MSINLGGIRENNFVWRTCPQTDLLVLSVMDGISATSVSCTHIIQWVGQLDSLEISKFQFVSIGNSCVSKNSNSYYIEGNYAETYKNSKFLDMYISKCIPFLFLIEIGTIANVNFQKKDSPHMEVGIHSFAFVNKRQPCVVYSNAPWLTNFGDTHKDRWPPRCGCVSTPTLRDTL